MKRIRGRQYLLIFSPFVRILIVFFRLMPHGFISNLWGFIDFFHGKIGLGLRYCILKGKAGSCGNFVYIGPNVEIRNIHNLHIGNNVSIHRFCYLDALGKIYIGNNVSVAHNCSIISFEHTWGDQLLPIKENPLVATPIILEDDIWLGCGVRVLSGVRISSRCVIAAGAVVCKDLPSGFLYAGVPAKPIKILNRSSS